MIEENKTEEFIKRAREIHGDKYDYSKVNYINCKTKVKIICLVHGIFEQRPDHHINRKQGCKKCGHEKIKYNQLTTEEFIERANQVHNNFYDYSLVDYTDSVNKVKIICKIHGIFEQSPGSHIYNKTGCPKCKGGILQTQEEFIEKAKEIHNNKYDYSKVDYKNSKTKIEIICPVHGSFFQTPHKHLLGECYKCGCIKKGLSHRKTLEEFIEEANKIHNNKYDYSLVEFSGVFSKVKIKCSIHGIFEQTVHYHLRGAGCPVCNESRGEKEIRKILTENNISFISQYKFDDCKNINPLPFDFYLPELNILIEYQGIQHYKSNDFYKEFRLPVIQNNDRIKKEYCLKNNITLLEIKYNENIEDKLICFLKI